MTLQPGMSVSRVARIEGVNAHQVFDWRRAYREGRLGEAGACGLLPVIIAGTVREEEQKPTALVTDAVSGGAVHIELPGVACISVESGADVSLVRIILETLRP